MTKCLSDLAPKLPEVDEHDDEIEELYAKVPRAHERARKSFENVDAEAHRLLKVVNGRQRSGPPPRFKTEVAQ